MAPRTLADKDGRPYVRLDDLRAGDRIELDDGFTCCKPHTTTVHADKRGELYFKCNDGRHYVAGQLERGSLIGIYRAVNGVAQA